MTLNYEQTEDVSVIEQTKKPGVGKAFKVFFTAVAIFLGAQIVAMVLCAGGYFFLNDFSSVGYVGWMTSIVGAIVITLFASLITLLVLKSLSNKSTMAELCDYWAIRSINSRLLLICLIISLVIFGVWYLTSFVVEIPPEPFMEQLFEAAKSSLPMFLLTVLMVSFVAPVFEEIFFRGWLFTEFKQTVVGTVGALFITSLLFTLVHANYQTVYSFFQIFCMGLFFGLIRVKTNNISYAVLCHMFYNTIVLIEVFS